MVSTTTDRIFGVGASTVFNGGASDGHPIYLNRVAAYAGGTPGFVNNCLCVETDVTSPSATAYEWTFLTILNNQATGGQNVAFFGQGTAQVAGAGPTWAGVFEGRDTSAAANPTSGRVSVEIDRRDNGTDSGLNRVALDVVCTRPLINGAFTGATATIGYGVRVGSFGDTTTSVGAGYTVFDTNVGFAFDCGNATVTAGALRMPSGAAILFDTPGVNQLFFDGVGLKYSVNGTPVARINQNGTLNIGTGAYGAGGAFITSVSGLTGTSQVSGQLGDILAGTVESAGIRTLHTIAAATAVTNYRGFRVTDPTLNAGASIQFQDAFFADDETHGTSRISAFCGNVSTGANKYNCFMTGTAPNFFQGIIQIPGGAQAILQSTTAMTSNAGSGAGTLTNAPAAGNPTKWVPFNDNGTIRNIPMW